MSNQVIAITDADAAAAGLIVWFTYSGHVDHTALQQAWKDINRDPSEVPHPPGPETSMLRALNEVKGPRTLVRPLANRKGYAIVHEDAKETDLDYNIIATTTINPIGRLEVEAEATPRGDDIKARIKSAYKRHLFSQLSTNDISGWVSRKLLPKVDSLSLRSSGGFYFIPRDGLPAYRKMVTALQACSNHSFYSVPGMKSEDAVESILGSLREEAETLARGMWDDIGSGKLGGRALEARATTAAEMQSKVERYEKLLGVAMTDLSESLDQLKANMTAAALKASAGEDYTGLASLGDLL